MKNLIDAVVVGSYLLTIAIGGNYALKATYKKVQKLALEKSAQGLGDLETITQRMTGKKLNF